MKKTNLTLGLLLMLGTAFAQKKPNIVVIFGDDISTETIGAYNRGLFGVKTPNIDRIAKEGMIFTDAYAQNSCTAGRAAFITGQHSFRTGLLTIGMPGAKHGIRKTDATIADMLKPLGYNTYQIGKNHLGDRNEYLPTVHGFDYFYGNLYHLNAEEEPFDNQYPKDPKFKEMFGPRGVLESWATTSNDATDQNRWGVVGKQRVQDTGPLTPKRMEDIEYDLTNHTVAKMRESVKENKPFFLWHNSTRNHVWIHMNDKMDGISGYGPYEDALMELDNQVGVILKEIDDLGIADNTIIMFTTDNGTEVSSWPQGGITAFKGEKGTTWEGGFRVPLAIRWPGHIPAGTVNNNIIDHTDWMPTFLAAAGQTDLKEKLLTGHNGFKVHLDGYNQLDLITTNDPKNAKRKEIFYFDAHGSLNAVRYGDWKLNFKLTQGALWDAYVTTPSWPKIINLRMDPYERSLDSDMYLRWQGSQMWTMVPAQSVVAKFLESFKDFPPAEGSSLSVDNVLRKMKSDGR
ncbi:arylsulfatase [Pedobacter sp. MW01-1-1]|uniref:arylsulfatase n=1 Tax=Pedobacter sp. MW01-1-1 TaxID=3383027 RepID=UPI003FF081F4